MNYPCKVLPLPTFGPTVNLIQGSQIVPQSIEWLWNGWLAAGKLEVLAGPPGVAKTTIAVTLAATMTIGGRWPDGSRAPVGSVLIWSGEDDPSDTLAPRLIAAGADMSKVYFVGSVSDGEDHQTFDPAIHLEALTERARQIGDVKLVIVDPIVSAVQGDSHKNTEVRRALQPLVELGAETGACILGITHFAKGGAGNDPTERVVGSVAFSALARLVLVAAKLPDQDGQPGRRVLARSKSNIGRDDGGFAYSVEQCELDSHPGVWASRIWWGEALEGSARDLLQPEEEAEDEDRNEVDKWLRELLEEEGGSATKADVIKAAQASGFPKRTVERACKRIGAKVTTPGYGKEKRAVWSLPILATQSRHSINHGENGENGADGENDGESYPPISPCSPTSPCSPYFQSGENDGENGNAPSWTARAGLEVI